ncbi:hypothetical protein MNBD_GAMMA03-1940 [hydrothermal vent metagenome]|uniref:Uncharacterized protein n=1 Tax=hydrothermal vent metagenome TaxID=652676 RepID=A0A3B0W9F3_9ZZZZ
MKIIFYITHEGLNCYKEHDIVVDFFLWEEVEEIDAYLTSLSENTLISIVIDVIEEDIYFEWAPRLLPWEKQSFLERRKSRFSNEEFSLSEVQWTNYQREGQAGRKEELLLISLLANDEHFVNFLTKLEEAQILVTSIYSKPFLLVEYFKKRVKSYLKLSKKELLHPFLVVSRESEYAFRQIFFYEGQLRISRLVELDHESRDMTTSLAHETKLAIAYVRSQDFISPDIKIGLVFLDSDPELLLGLLKRCKQEGIVSSVDDEHFFKALSFNDLTQKKQYCSVNKNRCFSRQAMVDFIFASQLKGFYSNPYIKKIKGFILGRQVFIGLNILLLLGGIYYIVVSSVNALVSWEKQAIYEQKIIEHNTEVVRLKKVVNLQDNAQHIKASVEFSEAILKLKLSRVVAFDIEQWSEVFNQHSQHIQLSDMYWKTLKRFDSRESEITITAWVFPFYETYKDPVKWVDDFVEDFKKLPGVKSVELQQEPLNRNLTQTLIIDATQKTVDALPFTVKIGVKDVEFK